MDFLQHSGMHLAGLPSLREKQSGNRTQRLLAGSPWLPSHAYYHAKALLA